MKFSIGPWVADTATNEITDGAATRRLEARAMDVLLELYRAEGAVVSKDDLIQAVWKRYAVTDHAVTVVISDLRSALDDSSRDPKYIQTVPKRGYRLLALECAGVSDEGTNADGPPAGTVAPSTRIPVLFKVIGPLAAMLLLVMMIFWSRSPEPSPLATEAPALMIRDTVSTFDDGEHKALASSLTAIALETAMESDGVSVVRLRGAGDENVAGARWIMDTRLILTEAGPAAFIEVADGAAGTILWTGHALITPERFAKAHNDLVTDALQAIGIHVDNAARASTIAASGDLYWQARLFWDLRTKDGAMRSRALLEEALRLNSDDARLHAALADLYAHKAGWFFWDEEPNALALARDHLRQAEALSPNGFDVRLARAHITLYVDGDAERASDLLRTLTAEKPSHPIAHRSLGYALAADAQYSDAVAAIERAVLLDPLNATTAWEAVWILYASARYDATLRAVDHAEALSGNGDLYRGLSYAALGNDAQAMTMFRRLIGPEAALALPPGSTYGDLLALIPDSNISLQRVVLRAILAALAGDQEGAHDILHNQNPEVVAWAKLWFGTLDVFKE